MSTENQSAFNTPYGSFPLRRYPLRQREVLQAWCGADQLLLEHAAASVMADTQILICNDEFGALTVPLAARASSWSDSRIAHEAIERNLLINNIQARPEMLDAVSSKKVDCGLVLLRVPKQLSLLRYQLQLLSKIVAPGTPLVCGGMDKHLPRTLAEELERIIGPVTRHRGARKARLFSGVFQQSPLQTVDTTQRFFCEELGAEVSSLANVFSSGALDMGTRLLLQSMQDLQPQRRAVDLCCGNGVIGLCAMARHPDLLIDFIDESSLAVASARNNVASLFPERLKRCSFQQSDGFRHYRGDEVQQILCNPPFHQGHVVDDHAGRRLLRQAATVLRPGGELWLVANRHLKYAATLQRHFHGVQQIAQNQKFVVSLAHKHC